MSDAVSANKNKLHLSLDLRLICLILLVVIAGMLATWKPWQASASSGRTVQVSGEATVRDAPDEFVFYPSYEFKNTDKEAALAELSKKSDELVAHLKQLGVAASSIKTNTDSYNYPVYYQTTATTGDLTYTLQLTVTLTGSKLVQKVQDYLVSTAPTGAVSPQPSFSEAKRKQVEAKARDLATKDARKKADQMATNLGFKVGSVKSVSDSAGFDTQPLTAAAAASDTVKSLPTLSVQPGQNDLNYSVNVTYFIR